MAFFNDSDFIDFEDSMLNNTIDDRNTTINIEETIETSNNRLDSVLWLCIDILFVIYSLTILVFVVKKHRHHLEPVHLLTLSAFINIILNFLDFIIYDFLSIIWNRPVLNVLSKYFGDLNGLIFVRFDVYYYEWITNCRAIV